MEKLGLTGQVFDYLTVVSPLPNRGGLSRWLCCCVCNTEIEVSTKILRKGSRTSCGCKKGSLRTTHGMTHTSTYHIWAEMKARCRNPNNQRYDLYGARGITYDSRWERFENFLEDMGIRPEGLSLERVDNSKGYCLINCKWATDLEQARNNRRNLSICYGGKSITLAEAVEIVNRSRTSKLKYTTAYCRLKSYGWTVQATLESDLFSQPIEEEHLYDDRAGADS